MLHSLHIVFCCLLFCFFYIQYTFHSVTLRMWFRLVCKMCVSARFCRDGGKWRCFETLKPFSGRLCLPEFEDTNWSMSWFLLCDNSLRIFCGKSTHILYSSKSTEKRILLLKVKVRIQRRHSSKSKKVQALKNYHLKNDCERVFFFLFQLPPK